MYTKLLCYENIPRVLVVLGITTISGFCNIVILQFSKIRITKNDFNLEHNRKYFAITLKFARQGRKADVCK